MTAAAALVPLEAENRTATALGFKVRLRFTQTTTTGRVRVQNYTGPTAAPYQLPDRVGQAVFLPTLVARLREAAPSIGIVTAGPPLDVAQQMMKLGQIDLAVGLFSGLHVDFHQQLLFLETYVALVRKNHPTVGKCISEKQFFAAEHVIYTPTSGSHVSVEARINELCKEHGYERRVALQLGHSTGLANIVSTTDLVACVPRTFSRVLATRQDVRAVELPFSIEALEIAQFWHERYQRDEGHHWLRALIYQLFHKPGSRLTPAR